MLTLSRRKRETIRISDDIVITVNEIRGDKVSLGIEAPKCIPVHRGEVYEAIQRAQRDRFQQTRTHVLNRAFPQIDSSRQPLGPIPPTCRPRLLRVHDSMPGSS